MVPTLTISHDLVSLAADRPVRAIELPVREKVLPHDHDFCEICFVAAGRGIHLDAKGSTPMAPGDVFVTLPGECHAIQPVSGLRVWNIYYLAEWFLGDIRQLEAEPAILTTFFAHQLFRPPTRSRPSHLRVPAAAGRRVLAELRQIAREGGRPASSGWLIRACFEKVLRHLVEEVRVDSLTNAAVRREEVRIVMARTEELVKAGATFDPVQVSRGAAIGPDRLGRLFKQHTGLTPFAYYQRRRLQVACGLLLARNTGISEIAASLGFADASHFGREFRRQYGQTPRQFRLQFLASGAGKAP